MTKVTERSGKKDGKAKKVDGPSVEQKEFEPMKTEMENEGPVAAEAPSEEEDRASVPGTPQTGEQEVEQESDPSEEKADSGPTGLSTGQKTEQIIKENEELQDKFVRLMADFDNYKKRASKEKSDVIQFGNEDLLKDLLPIIDNIERLLTYSYGEGSWKSFEEGIELLLAEVSRTFAKYGVEPIEALGKPFDPNLHQAMLRSETDEADADTVVEVYQKGYLYHGKLLRPSLVVVAVPPKGEGEKKGEEDAPGSASPNGEEGEAGDEGKNEEKSIN